jgi:pyruvate dehydrogenase E2 component (dihydrolipoamide acetyltransferase)
MDFECQDEGYLAKILIPANTKDVKVGQPLAILVDDVADVPKFASFVAAAPASAPTPPPQAPKAATAPSPASSRPAQPPAASSPRSPTDRVKASPLARKIAREKGIPLEELVGRGPHGRIVKMDVDSYTPSARPAGAAASTGKPRAPRPRPAKPFTDLPLSNIRKVGGYIALFYFFL